jgi:hypothetical protein
MAAVEEVACTTCGLLPGGEASGAADVCTCAVEVVDAEVVPEGGELVVYDRQSGEALTVKDAGDELLARFMLSADEWLDQQRRDVQRAKDAVNAELLARMDGRLKWTHRARLGDIEFELNAPSPSAGKTAYDVDRMAAALRPFVEDKTLSQEAFEEVVKRTVTVKVTGHDTGRLERFAKNEYGASVGESTSVHLPAVAKLEKLEDPRITEAIAAAQITPEAIKKSDRKVKVSIKTKRKR